MDGDFCDICGVKKTVMDKNIDIKTRRRIQAKKALRIGVVIVVIAAVVIIPLMIFGGKSVRRSDLTITTAEEGPLETAVTASGRFVAAREEIVISPVASRIIAMYASPGDSVKEGMPLIELDLMEAETQMRNMADQLTISQKELEQQQLANRSLISDLQTQISIKEMEVNRLAIQVENERRLDSIGSGTGDRVRAAQTSYLTARLELEGDRQRLANERLRLASLEDALRLKVGNSARDLETMRHTMSRSRIPAPLDGVLTYLGGSIGANVAAGEKLAVVSDLTRLKIKGEIAETNSFKLTPGASVTIRYGNEETNGIVASIEPQSRDGSVPFTVTLSQGAADRHIRPGLRAQLYIDYGYKESVTRIPSGNYYKGPGQYTIFVAVSPTTLERRQVTLGESNRSWVEVVSGIRPGENVVISDMERYLSYSTLNLK